MDSRKPLTAREIARDTVYVERVTNGKECGENCPCSYANREDELSCILDGKELACTWEPERGLVYFRTPRCLSLLTPPSDAAVREAVGIVEEVRKDSAIGGYKLSGFAKAAFTLLRAVQAPRLTREQKEAVADHRDWLCENGFWDEVFDIEEAFPRLRERRGCIEPHEVFAGEVGRG